MFISGRFSTLICVSITCSWSYLLLVKMGQMKIKCSTVSSASGSQRHDRLSLHLKPATVQVLGKPAMSREKLRREAVDTDLLYDFAAFIASRKNNFVTEAVFCFVPCVLFLYCLLSYTASYVRYGAAVVIGSLFTL